MENKAKLGKLTMFNIVLFGFIGQVAWAVENNYFNTFLFNVIGGNSKDISNMVAASSVVAVLTTLIMGTLSDKINKRKIFICGGYIVWGFTVMVFALISRENVGKLLGIDAVAALSATVSIAIIMDCVMTFMGSTSNDAAFNAWITDITVPQNRARTEGVLATLPVLAMVIVTVAFGVLASSFGYPACFTGLGILVTICGIIGLFTVKDSLNGQKKETHFFSELIYGFRPTVIKSNKGLYLSLACFCIYGTAIQVFFPYLFIYVQHQIGLDFANLNISPALAIVAVLVIAAVIAGAIIMGSLMDKYGRSYFAVPSILLLVIGLVACYFAEGLVKFAICAVIFLAGYGLISILLSAAIRDFTPEGKAGSFQGIRMIFCVMIPMIIGPAIGSAVTEKFAIKTYTNDYGEIVNLPPPHIFMAGAVVAVLVFIPLIFLIKEWKKVEKQS
jgi:MFS family permease